MKILNDFSELKNFCSSYFHEDWPAEGKDTAEIVSNYLAERWSAAELGVLVEQIRRFLAIHLDDQTLERALFEDLGCYYIPSADNISARVWFSGVATALLDAAENRPSSGAP